jgi:hypothetical protein
MASHNQTCTDDEFIAIWEKHQSATKVARELGVAIRNVQNRRRNLETFYNIKLFSADPRSSYYDRRQASYSPLKQIDLGIIDGTVLVFSDAHFIPSERTTAYKGLLWAIENLKPKAVIANGDSFDGASISRHDVTDEAPTTVIQELNACKAALGEIEERAKAERHNVRLIHTWGNHDARFANRLAQHAPQYKDVLGFKITDHIPDWEFCWVCWPTSKVIVKHRYKGGIHATHNNAVSSGVSMCTGHLHSLKVTPYSDYNGIRYGIDTGTLAEPDGPQFTYAELNPTNHRSGFAVLTFFNGELLWPELVHTFNDEGHIQFRGDVIDVSAF